jgi:secondary thiamine-phosphate synthase enzyme
VEVIIGISKTRLTEDSLSVLPSSGQAVTMSVTVGLRTTKTTEFIDITEQVAAAVAEADLTEGLALVSSPHTTCQVIINEAEDGFLRDLARTLERLAPEDDSYDHDEAPHDLPDEEPNGYAHIRAALLSSPSVTVPIVDGRLSLGTWQRLFFVELDRARPRRFQVTVVGRTAE